MQRIFDPESNTLHFLPKAYLAEDTTYEIVISNGLSVNWKSVTAKVTTFTTGNVTGTLDTIRQTLDKAGPPKSSIVASQSMGMILWTAHRATLPAGSQPQLNWDAYEGGTGFDLVETFSEAGGGINLPMAIGPSGKMESATPPGGGPVRIFQRFGRTMAPSMSAIHVGYFESPWYLTNERVFTDQDAVQQDTRAVWFTLYLPKGDPPASGWPVILYCNGYRSHRHHASPIADRLAQEGLATLAINTVGHGGGPDGYMQFGLQVVSDGGRAVDTNNDGQFALQEGMASAWLGPNHTHLAGLTDGVRQSVIDFMVAVRMLQNGLGEISTKAEDRGYFGISNGGRIGAILMGIDPLLPTAVLNVPPSEAYLPLEDQ
jgi:hypothetical protein